MPELLPIAMSRPGHKFSLILLFLSFCASIYAIRIGHLFSRKRIVTILYSTPRPLIEIGTDDDIVIVPTDGDTKGYYVPRNLAHADGEETWNWWKQRQLAESILQSAIASNKTTILEEFKNFEPYLSHEKADILNANAQFFQSISDANINFMRSLWLDSNDSLCIKAGDRNVVTGYHNIMNLWSVSFANEAPPIIAIRNVSLYFQGDMAVVTSTVEFTNQGLISDGPKSKMSKAFSQYKGSKKRSGDQNSAHITLATNVFIKPISSDRYNLAVHIANILPAADSKTSYLLRSTYRDPSAPSKNGVAGRQQQQQGFPISLQQLLGGSQGMTFSIQNSEGDSEDENEDDTEDDDYDDSEYDDDGEDDGEDDGDGSDNSENDESDDEDEAEYVEINGDNSKNRWNRLSEILKRATTGGTRSERRTGGLLIIGSGTGASLTEKPDGNRGSRRQRVPPALGSVIDALRSITGQNNGNEDSGDSSSSSGSSPDQDSSNEKSGRKRRLVDDDDDDDDNEDGEDDSDDDDESTSAAKDLSSKALLALRWLYDRKRISGKEKRLLTEDIIQNSAAGRYSRAEVALSLLLGPGHPDDVIAATEEVEGQRYWTQTLGRALMITSNETVSTSSRTRYAVAKFGEQLNGAVSDVDASIARLSAIGISSEDIDDFENACHGIVKKYL